MSKTGELFKALCAVEDKKRDKNLQEPKEVKKITNIPYAFKDKYNLLDVYYTEKTEGVLPVIVNIHGGGYVYGTKEVYIHYGMFLAMQGFAVVNFNYHLAPKYKFPVQLGEINQVLKWIENEHEKFKLDIENIFLVGDSAGAQLTSHYCTIYSNKEKKQPIDMNDLLQDYLGKDRECLQDKLNVNKYITDQFPPAFVMTSWYDFLKEKAKPMYELLKERGVVTEYKLYGHEGEKHMGHVFHVNMNLEEAKKCNLDEIEFFKKLIYKL